MLAYLFSNTRHWAERWIGKLVALALLELLVAIELKIVLTQFQAFMGTQEAASGTGIDADELIANLWGIGWAFWFGAAMMIGLPAIAAAIGGSHVSNMVVTHINLAGNAMGRMVTSPATTAAASKAASSTARSAAAARSRVNQS
jgi:type IV secretory pathway VirB6-like protein